MRGALFALTLTSTLTVPLAAAAADRILSIGGSVTEILYALGGADKLVARDTTSSFPPEAEALPDVGYMRALAPEGVLSVNPDLIVAEAGAGPVETLEVLKEAKIAFVEVPDAFTPDGILAKIRAVGAAVEIDPEPLVSEVKAGLDTVAAKVATVPEADRKKVLFILSTRGGRIMASGRGTAADGIIEMAGGVNALAEFDGYKLMTDEAVSQAAPDVILMMDRGGDHGAPDAELLAMPALVTTPAAEAGAVVRMNGLYLLGFGPRTADAALELAQSLYGPL